MSISLISLLTTTCPAAQGSPSDQQGSSYQKIMTKIAHSPFKELYVGLAAGGLEVVIDQPLISIKNMLQRRIRVVNPSPNSPFSFWTNLTVRQLYAGMWANGVGTSAIIGVQMQTFKLAQEALTHTQGLYPFSNAKQLTASLAAGMVSAPIASGSEMLMDCYRQHTKDYEEGGKKGKRPTYGKAILDLYRRYGVGSVTRGLVPTIGREMGFAAAYISGGPYFARCLINNPYFQESIPPQFPVELIANSIGGAVAGAIGAVVTHPFDTWKTLRQAGIGVNFWPEGIYTIIKKSQKIGRIDQATLYVFRYLLQEPYKGLGPRFARVVLAITFLNLMNHYSEKHLAQFK